MTLRDLLCTQPSEQQDPMTWKNNADLIFFFFFTQLVPEKLNMLKWFGSHEEGTEMKTNRYNLTVKGNLTIYAFPAKTSTT